MSKHVAFPWGVYEDRNQPDQPGSYDYGLERGFYGRRWIFAPIAALARAFRWLTSPKSTTPCDEGTMRAIERGRRMSRFADDYDDHGGQPWLNDQHPPAA